MKISDNTLEYGHSELTSHGFWHDQGGSMYVMPQRLEVFYTNGYWYMSYHTNKGVEVKHVQPSSDVPSHE